MLLLLLLLLWFLINFESCEHRMQVVLENDKAYGRKSMYSHFEFTVSFQGLLIQRMFVAVVINHLNFGTARQSPTIILPYLE